MQGGGSKFYGRGVVPRVTMRWDTTSANKGPQYLEQYVILQPYDHIQEAYEILLAITEGTLTIRIGFWGVLIIVIA